MFLAHRIDLGELEPGSYEVAIRCAALAPLLAQKRPRPRWRTRLVRHQNLRWFRTTLLGRMPGWSSTGAAVGPWRPVTIAPTPTVIASQVRARCDGADGVVDVTVELGDDGTKGVEVVVGDVRGGAVIDGRRAHATVRVPAVERWWPHTHGSPVRYDVSAIIDGESHPLGHVGFRTVEARTDDGGFDLYVNGERVFCRGASWMPVDPAALSADAVALRSAMHNVRRAHMNMLRVNGTTVYESDDFYELCDELGILVWQDAMFANMDPPDDAAFVSGVEAEVAQLLDRIGHRPSLAVICGGSEVEQQAAMLGLPRDRWIMPLFDEVIPAVVASKAPGLPYVTSSPTGGTLPFHADAGIAHYYGVGAYRRPLTDARRAGVRFTTECLAFSNVPVAATVEHDLGGSAAVGHHPAWKQGVPRDNGASWDFEDVRDHYVRELFEVDPDSLRSVDPDRYLALGRVTTGEVMASTFAEWRRAGSLCSGGLIWFLRDLRPGAGWGVVDAFGRPKPAWWYLRRAMAPVALFAIDEGLNGLHLHVVNDSPDTIEGTLRVELFTRGELRTEVAEQPVKVNRASTVVVVADALFDGFRDLTWAYRFGPSGHDVISATLVHDNGDAIAQAVHLPLGLSRSIEPDLGLEAPASPRSDGTWALALRSRRFAQSVVIDVEGFDPDDNWLHVSPGTDHVVILTPINDDTRQPAGEVRALNAVTGTRIRVEP
jgi:beta-mannosidase